MKRFIIDPKADTMDLIIRRIVEYIRLFKPKLKIQVTVGDYKRNRSLEQNDRLWAMYKIIGDELGYTKDEIHSLMRYKFLGMDKKEVAGEIIEELPSTTKLKVGDMIDYQDDIERWANGMGIRMPARDYND